MKHRSYILIKRLLFLLVVMVNLYSCDECVDCIEDNSAISFECISLGAKFYYTQIDSTGIRDSLTLIEITKDPYNSNLLINVENSNGDYAFDFYMGMYIVKRNNGLYTDCPPDWVSIHTTYYLRVPAFPQLGQTIPEYYSEDSISSNFIVTNIDTMIQTDLGDINCFRLKNDQSCFIEYWNEQTGLVQVEKLDSNKQLIKTYLLSKIEHADSIFIQ